MARAGPETCCSCLEKCLHGFDNLVSELKQVKKDLDGQVNCKQCCRDLVSRRTLRKKFPILQWLPKYRFEHFQGDLIAGVAVGLTIVPQSLAYAFIANLPPQYGLYTSFIGCLLYCVLGTSKDVNLGPTAVISLMTASYTAIDFAGKTEADESILRRDVYPVIATVHALGSGVILLIMALIRVGFLVEYISHPVINSFTTAAAITIFCSQIKKWLVLPNIPREFIPQAIETLKKLKHTKLYDFLLGLVCMILLLFLKKVRDMKFCNKKPGPVIAKLLWILSMSRNASVILLASVLAWCLHRYDIDAFKLTGELTPGLPPVQVPAFQAHAVLSDRNITMNYQDIFNHIGAGFALLPIIAYIEIVAIAKAFGRRNGYRVDADQELIALGLANFFSCFVSAYPLTASFSRSAVNMQSGVMTPAGGIATGALVILAVAFLTNAFHFIPEAALAAVIMMAVVDITDFSMIPKLWRIKKADLLPWLVTFFVGLGYSIEYGIICGVAVSLALLLFPWARPGLKVTELPEASSLPICPDSSPDSSVLLVKPDHGLRFPGIDYVREKVVRLASEGDVKYHVILDCSKLSSTDFSSVHFFEDLHAELLHLQLKVTFINLEETIQRMLEAAGINKVRVFDSVDEALIDIKQGPCDDEVIIPMIENTPAELNRTDDVEIMPDDSVVATAIHIPQENITCTCSDFTCDNMHITKL